MNEWLNVRFLAWAWNAIKGDWERLEKTDDARNALHVHNQHQQPLTNSELAAATVKISYEGADPIPVSGSVSVSGSVEVSNFPTSFAVSNFPASFAVSNLPTSYPLPQDQVDALTPPDPQPVEFPTEYPLPPAQLSSLTARDDFPNQQLQLLLESVLRQCGAGPGFALATKVECPDPLPVHVTSTPQDNGTKFFFSNEFGINMNQDGAGDVSVTQVDWIHGGGPTGEAPVGETAWTPSQPVGGSDVNFNQSQLLLDPPPGGGTFYIDARDGDTDDEWQFLADNPVLPAAGVSDLEFQLYVQRWENQESRDCFVRLMHQGSDIGPEISLRNDLAVDRSGSLNTWQLVRAPMSLLNPSNVTFDTVRFRLGHGRVDLCFDSLRLIASTAPSLDLTFAIQPDEGDILQIDGFKWLVVDNIAQLNAAGGPVFDPYKIGDLGPLSNGLLYRRIQNGVTIQTFTVRGMLDLLRVPGATMEIHQGPTTTGIGVPDPGTQTTYNLTFKLARPLVLKSSDGDRIEYLIRDDLSGLRTLHVSALAGQYPDPDFIPV